MANRRSILITGASDGIGKLVAQKFANEGHILYIHGRNQKKIRTTLEEIKEESHNNDIIPFIADFSDLHAVNKMADAVVQKIGRLDLLVNNAGTFRTPIDNSSDGLDLRLTVNYLAPFLLTSKLLPLLRKGVEPRIVNVSSAAQSPLSMEVLIGIKRREQGETYAQSKLALTMWSFYLAKQEAGITVAAVNPGSLLNTKMAYEAYGKHWFPAEKGANVIFDLSLSEEHTMRSGYYYDSDAGNYAEAHVDAYDESKIEELIATTRVVLEGVS